MDTVILSSFDWAVVIGIGIVLTGIIAFFSNLYFKGIRCDLDQEIKNRKDALTAESDAREEADMQLAKLLKEISESLHNHERWSVQEHAQLSPRADVSAIVGKVEMKVDAFHNRLDEIRDLLTDIKTGYVTKDDCHRIHSNK